MSKSSKRRKGPVAPAQAVTGGISANPKPSSPPANRPVATPVLAKPTNGALLQFNTPTRWYLGVVVGLFVLFTLSKIHTISSPIWDLVLPDGHESAPRGLLAGTNRAIRVDEWGVSLPWELSNVNKGFPLENETIGGKQVGLLLMPTYHLFSLFRPANWGFLLFDAERGLAWKGNLDYVLLLTGAFLLLMLLTRNDFWLSLFGTLWLWLSAGIQNWNGGISVVFGVYCYLFALGIHLLFSERQSWRWWLMGLVFGWLLFTQVFLLYPPYQVPMGYTFLILTAAYIWTNRHEPGLRYKFAQKASIVGLSIVIFALMFYVVYEDLKPTLDAVSQTVYPGKRLETGGTGFKANWFSEFYSWFVGEDHLPKSWDNICELAHFLTFVPVIIPALAVSFYRTRQVNWFLVGLGVWVLIMLSWMTFHWPVWLAKGTLMSMSPTRRMQIPLGVTSVLLTVLYLQYLKNQAVQVSQAVQIGLVALVGLFIAYTAYYNLEDSEGFFKLYQLVVPVIWFTVLYALLLPTVRLPYRQLTFSVGVLVFLLPNLSFNPLSRGLEALTEHSLYKAVRAIHETDPNARWVAFDNRRISEMITATGANIISGVKYLPPDSIYNALDPTHKLDSTYNRYAHTIYKLHIDGKDGVIMQNVFEDECIVAVDPCSPKLRKLNVRYVVFDGQPPVDLATRCMTLMQEVNKVRIYKVN